MYASHIQEYKIFHSQLYQEDNKVGQLGLTPEIPLQVPTFASADLFSDLVPCKACTITSHYCPQRPCWKLSATFW